MTSDEILVAFLTLLGVCVRALVATTRGADRETITSPLHVTDESGRRVRDGEVAGLGSFHLHGVGCRFELDGGEDVDFDWDAEGNVVFDGWRLRSFAQSVGVDSLEVTDFDSSARSLVSRGLLQERRPGWFSISGLDPRT